MPANEAPTNFQVLCRLLRKFPPGSEGVPPAKPMKLAIPEKKRARRARSQAPSLLVPRFHPSPDAPRGAWGTAPKITSPAGLKPSPTIRETTVLYEVRHKLTKKWVGASAPTARTPTVMLHRVRPGAWTKAEGRAHRFSSDSCSSGLPLRMRDFALILILPMGQPVDLNSLAPLLPA